MKIKSVFDKEFIPYGKVIEGCDLSAVLQALAGTPKPGNGTVYQPSAPELESPEAAKVIEGNLFGGMPVQIGYCNGTNTTLNCLEYHRDSEVNIPENDMIFLVAQQQKIADGKLDTAEVEAFRAPGGTAVELYATTLHYAPCDAKTGEGFRVAVVLPRGTNTDKPAITQQTGEDALLWARNKWLLAHSESSEARQGAHIGLTGENIDIAGLI